MVIEVQDPQLGPIKLVGNPMKMSANEPILDVPSPILNQDTKEVLESLGIKEKEISDLRHKGIIG